MPVPPCLTTFLVFYTFQHIIAVFSNIPESFGVCLMKFQTVLMNSQFPAIMKGNTILLPFQTSLAFLQNQNICPLVFVALLQLVHRSLLVMWRFLKFVLVAKISLHALNVKFQTLFGVLMHQILFHNSFITAWSEFSP